MLQAPLGGWNMFSRSWLVTFSGKNEYTSMVRQLFAIASRLPYKKKPFCLSVSSVPNWPNQHQGLPRDSQEPPHNRHHAHWNCTTPAAAHRLSSAALAEWSRHERPLTSPSAQRGPTDTGTTESRTPPQAQARKLPLHRKQLWASLQKTTLPSTSALLTTYNGRLHNTPTRAAARITHSTPKSYAAAAANAVAAGAVA